MLQLELEAVGKLERELAQWNRRRFALEDRDDLRALGDSLDGGRKRGPGATPGDHGIVDEANRVAAHEAPLGIVARSGRNGRRADLLQRGLEPLRVRRRVI